MELFRVARFVKLVHFKCNKNWGFSCPLFLAIWMTFITYLFLHDGFQHANHKATIPSKASASLLL